MLWSLHAIFSCFDFSRSFLLIVTHSFNHSLYFSSVFFAIHQSVVSGYNGLLTNHLFSPPSSLSQNSYYFLVQIFFFLVRSDWVCLCWVEICFWSCRNALLPDPVEEGLFCWAETKVKQRSTTLRVSCSVWSQGFASTTDIRVGRADGSSSGTSFAALPSKP